jgi:hypothetical protein
MSTAEFLIWEDKQKRRRDPIAATDRATALAE